MVLGAAGRELLFACGSGLAWPTSWLHVRGRQRYSCTAASWVCLQTELPRGALPGAGPTRRLERSSTSSRSTLEAGNKALLESTLTTLGNFLVRSNSQSSVVKLEGYAMTLSAFVWNLPDAGETLLLRAGTGWHVQLGDVRSAADNDCTSSPRGSEAEFLRTFQRSLCTLFQAKPRPHLPALCGGCPVYLFAPGYLVDPVGAPAFDRLNPDPNHIPDLNFRVGHLVLGPALDVAQSNPISGSE